MIVAELPLAMGVPDAGPAVCATVTPGQLSEAVGADQVGALLSQADIVMFEGQVIDGAVLSFTVTVNEQVEVFPQPS